MNRYNLRWVRRQDRTRTMDMIGDLHGEWVRYKDVERLITEGLLSADCTWEPNTDSNG